MEKISKIFEFGILFLLSGIVILGTIILIIQKYSLNRNNKNNSDSLFVYTK